VELHCHSFYSLLDGTSSPGDLVSRAADLGMEALALTDHDAVYGAVPFVTVARARGIRPILGAELTLERDHHLTLLVERDAGWRNLCSRSAGRERAAKGHATLAWADLDGHTDGLIRLSGCRQGRSPARCWYGSHGVSRAPTARPVRGRECGIEPSSTCVKTTRRCWRACVARAASPARLRRDQQRPLRPARCRDPGCASWLSDSAHHWPRYSLAAKL
jgi:hypothetical protein